jgi:hypothetical protein
MTVQLVNGRWLYGYRQFQELDSVEKRLFAILLKVELIIANAKKK